MTNRLVICALIMVGAATPATWLSAQEPPVASFEAAVAEAPPESQPAANPAQSPANGTVPTTPTLSFSFRFAPWEDVLVKFAEVAGLTLDLTEVPPGTFNYLDKGQYTPTEALDILNGYLLQRGFVLVRRDRFLVCVNLEKGIPAYLLPRITAEQLADYGDHELVSLIVSHDGMDASLAAGQIGQLQGPHGKIVSLNATNSLLVTDTAGNLRLINRLIEQGAFARPATSAAHGLKLFAVEHVRAEELERVIRTLFGLPAATSSSPDAAVLPQASDIRIMSDPRTNRLLVTASSATLASIEEVVTAYDVADNVQKRTSQRSTPTTRIVPLLQTDVILIGRALESLSPRIRVSATHRKRAANPAERRVTDTPDAAPTNVTAPGEDSPQSATSQSPSTRTPAPQNPTPQTPDGRDR